MLFLLWMSCQHTWNCCFVLNTLWLAAAHCLTVILTVSAAKADQTHFAYWKCSSLVFWCIDTRWPGALLLAFAAEFCRRRHLVKGSVMEMIKRENIQLGRMFPHVRTWAKSL